MRLPPPPSASSPAPRAEESVSAVFSEDDVFEVDIVDIGDDPSDSLQHPPPHKSADPSRPDEALQLEGLVLLLSSPDEATRVRAAVALCNRCADNDVERARAVALGAVGPLIALLLGEGPLASFARAASAACACNLAALRDNKGGVGSEEMFYALAKALDDPSPQAAAQAAGALWSLCVDSQGGGGGSETADDANKAKISANSAIPRLVKLLSRDDPFARSQAAGALSECAIRSAA
jgi:HEAT repeat protein